MNTDVPRLVLRSTLRAILVGLGFVCLSGAFSSAQLGCADPHYCGKKFLGCWVHNPQSDCQQDSACEWRAGCASACRRATTVYECSALATCAVNGATGACIGPGCQLPTGEDVLTADQCAPLANCNWEPSCWDAPNTDCQRGLDETECNRRHCTWEKQDNQL